MWEESGPALNGSALFRGELWEEGLEQEMKAVDCPESHWHEKDQEWQPRGMQLSDSNTAEACSGNSVVSMHLETRGFCDSGKICSREEVGIKTQMLGDRSETCAWALNVTLPLLP